MSNATLQLPAEFDIAHVSDIRNTLLGQADAGPVTLDASAITKMDGAGIQLLLAFVRQLQADGRSWSWSETSETVQRVAEMLSLTEELGLPNGGSGHDQ